MEDLLKFLMLFLIRRVLKPSFLRQSTDHPLDSIVVIDDLMVDLKDMS